LPLLSSRTIGSTPGRKTNESGLDGTTTTGSSSSRIFNMQSPWNPSFFSVPGHKFHKRNCRSPFPALQLKALSSGAGVDLPSVRTYIVTVSRRFLPFRLIRIRPDSTSFRCPHRERDAVFLFPFFFFYRPDSEALPRDVCAPRAGTDARPRRHHSVSHRGGAPGP